jgi:hypothetical protein
MCATHWKRHVVPRRVLSPCRFSLAAICFHRHRLAPGEVADLEYRRHGTTLGEHRARVDVPVWRPDPVCELCSQRRHLRGGQAPSVDGRARRDTLLRDGSPLDYTHHASSPLFVTVVKGAPVSRPVLPPTMVASSRFPRSVVCTTVSNAAPRSMSSTRSCANTELSFSSWPTRQRVLSVNFNVISVSRVSFGLEERRHLRRLPWKQLLDDRRRPIEFSV